uniref:AT-hook motif nuclear-localized protein n=1 Tax=Chenopodium quinoa TaxID=63459 RepID=A0A803NBL1_CHEQI
MEASKEEISSSGVAVKGDEGSQGFCLAARGENPLSQPGAPNMAAASSPVNLAGVPPSSDSRKKRGRPRKYGSDGAAAAALSPMPISASIPLSGDFSGDRLAYFVGANFTPHVITVNAGEGRFEILSLSGSFMPTDNGIMKSRSGGMSVSLAGPDGRVLGGGLAGLLVAASPVQVVLGSFLPGHHQEHKPKKQRAEPATTAAIPAIINNQVPEGGYGGQKVNFTSPPPHSIRQFAFYELYANGPDGP